LSPLAQQELDNEMRQDSTLSNLGYNLADQAKGTLSNGIDTSKLPALSGAPGATGNIQTSVGGTGAITDFGAQTKAAQDAVYGQYKSRLDPQWANAQNENDTKLANMGVMYNSSAYGKNQTQLDQAKNDAYQQANYQSVLAGSQEAQRLYGDQLAGSQFANQAQAQQYAQALQNSQFNNQARAQGLQEQTALRDLPINELNALRSSTQIQNPQFLGGAAIHGCWHGYFGQHLQVCADAERQFQQHDERLLFDGVVGRRCLRSPREAQYPQDRHHRSPAPAPLCLSICLGSHPHPRRRHG
jgi:hypothetical protein